MSRRRLWQAEDFFLDRNSDPVVNKLIIFARYNKSNSNLSIKPFDNFTNRLAKPLMNSNSPIEIANNINERIFYFQLAS
jgi:hypothetical protein